MKYFKQNFLFLFIAAIVGYAVLQVIQLNFYPLDWYPGWDNYWTDAMLVGKLAGLRNAASNFQIPIINPYIGLDWNAAGDTTLPISPLFPLNYLVLITSPINTLVIRSTAFFMIGGIGSFFHLYRFTKDRVISFAGATMYMSMAITSGTLYFHTMIATYM